jgi:hypothetical protein
MAQLLHAPLTGHGSKRGVLVCLFHCVLPHFPAGLAPLTLLDEALGGLEGACCVTCGWASWQRHHIDLSRCFRPHSFYPHFLPRGLTRPPLTASCCDASLDRRLLSPSGFTACDLVVNFARCLDRQARLNHYFPFSIGPFWQPYCRPSASIPHYTAYVMAGDAVILSHLVSFASSSPAVRLPTPTGCCTKTIIPAAMAMTFYFCYSAKPFFFSSDVQLFAAI